MSERLMAPLLRPADCSLLLVDARVQQLGRLSPERQSVLIRCLNLALDGARAGAVPIHLAFAGIAPKPEDCVVSPRPQPTAHVHALGMAGSGWSASGLDTALAAQNRSCLILAGFWLETTVTFLALPALASGFEVFVIMDAAPASIETAARPAADRLLQAGAVPITTRQLIAEWIEGGSDAGKHAALSLLIPAD
jgi:hypothetical protein